MIGYTIGELARQAEVNVETVRFYERKGILERPERVDETYRRYDETQLQRLRFVRQAKELGFTLKEIVDLLALRIDSQSNCEDVRIRAEQKLQEIREKMNVLRRMESGLQELTRACKLKNNLKKTSEGDCPILAAMDADVIDVDSLSD